ncbi:protein sidekick-2-like, partial [Stylophora pistillata]|uniref:protein sidekick-2-like n=1 Tax=Stylophora pistillata TaxID=50429 RepID=UPI000C04F33D
WISQIQNLIGQGPSEITLSKSSLGTNCRALGMENGYILDSQITASSELNSVHAAHYGRLNFPEGGGICGCWVALHKDPHQWYQVDFVRMVSLGKLATQGRDSTRYLMWVTSYSLSYSLNGIDFALYEPDGSPRVFNANVDYNTTVYHTINPIIFTRYIRVLPKTWHHYVSMRVEFYECDGHDVFDIEDLFVASSYLWTFDDVNDIKNVRGATWMKRSNSIQSVPGVRGRAVKTAGEPGYIKISPDHHYLLATPYYSYEVTIALWLFYESLGPQVNQTFLAAGDQANGDRGIHLYQADGSSEELTFETKSAQKLCATKFRVSQRIWTHLVIMWTTNLPDTLYRNGVFVTDLSNKCHSGNFANIASNSEITIGSIALPKASFDELIVWTKTLSKTLVEKLYRYYIGAANLHVNVSLKLTDESYHRELSQKESQMFQDLSSSLTSQLFSLYTTDQVIKVDNFAFWNMTVLAANFTVRFKGTGYREVKPLEQSIVTRHVLGNITVQPVAMEANSIYMKPLKVTPNCINSSAVSLSWNEPEQLSHGVFRGVEILYRLGDSSQRFVVMTSSGILEYHLTNLLPYRVYAISARPLTFQGEGKESEEVFLRTGESVPTSSPLNVRGFLDGSERINVTWQPVPLEHRNGKIIGYRVVYGTQGGLQQNVTVNVTTLSVVLGNLHTYTLYDIHVAAFTVIGGGPLSDAITVRSQEGGSREFVFSSYWLILSSIVSFWFLLAGCRALGMENYDISDAQITASSQFDVQHAARNARLNFNPRTSPLAGAWCVPMNARHHQWLQVDFEENVMVTQMATQGRFYDGITERNKFQQWVKTLSLNYSRDGVLFKAYEQLGKVKIFQGNWDSNTVVYNVITPAIYTRYIRILPKSWEHHICLRAEFYTCQNDVIIERVNLTSSVPSSTGVGLHWTPPDTVKLGEPLSGYRVEIFDLLRGKRFSYTVNSSMSGANLDILKPYTPYEFKVYGFTSSWEGNITNIISLKTKEDAPSQPPRNLTLKHTTNSELTFQLKPVDAYHINGVLRGYKVTYGESKFPNDTWKTFVINATHRRRRKRSADNETLSFSLHNLKKYTTYTITVLAFTVKDGVPTLATNFTTAEDVPDHPPTNLTALTTSSTSINVTWQPIPPDHAHGIILTYHVKYWRRDKPDDSALIATINSEELQVELKGLGKYKEYCIKVAGSTVAGFGNYSEPVFVRTRQDVPDEPPVNVIAKGTKPTVIQFQWSPVPDEAINGIGIGYKLALFNTTRDNIRNYTVNISVLSLEITGLEIWTSYRIKMVAFTVVGEGPWSDFISGKTDEEAPFKSPANLTGQVKNSTSIIVEWSSLVLPNLRGILRGYTVYYVEAPTSVHPSLLKNVSVDISITEVELTGLYKFTEYHIWVTSFTTREGLPSKPITLTTQEDSPDRPPLYVTYSAPSSTSLFVEWGSIPPRFENGIIRGFKVHFHEIPFNGTVEEMVVEPLLRWIILDNLKKFTAYSIQVHAFTTEGYGPGNSLTALTRQDAPTRPPASITTTNHVSLTTIPVSWQPIDPECINGILIGYKIRYQAVAVGEESVENEPIREQIVHTSTLSLMLKNLEVFTLYRIDVLGFTNMGDGPSATDYAETCRCHKRLTTSWYEFRPYVRLSDENVLGGLIPPILDKLAFTCCETCQSHGKS